MNTKHEIPLNKPVYLTVHLSNKSLNVHAKVIRKEEDGVCLQINNLSINSFVLLRDIVVESSQDHVAVLQETYKILKSIFWN
jgi:hypothetical protein